MYKWYADDSALKKNIGEVKRPVFLFGGILINREDEIKLSETIKKIKAEYTGRDMPIKYNVKDLKATYSQFKKEDDLRNLIHNSNTWRKQIVEEAIKFDFRIFISCIENFQHAKRNQKPIKEDLSAYLFANALMRVGLHAQNTGINYTQVITDWPEGNQSKPFDREYYYAYNRGKNSDGQEYFCGPLKNNGFDQTLYYARCNHSNMLQLADIVLGATRHWIETELQHRDYSIGKELAQMLLPKFHGYPNKILGYGINVSSNNQKLKSDLRQILEDNVA